MIITTTKFDLNEIISVYFPDVGLDPIAWSTQWMLSDDKCDTKTKDDFSLWDSHHRLLESHLDMWIVKCYRFDAATSHQK